MRTVLRLSRFLKKYWYWVILAYVCLFASTGFSLGIPELIKRAIDRGISLDLQTGQIFGDQQFLLFAGLAIVGASLLRGMFSFGQTYLGEFISQRIAYDIRNRLYDRIQRLSFAFHDKAQTGQLMSRATQDVEAVRIFISIGALRILFIAATFIGICSLLFSMNWTLALITLAAMPPVSYWAVRLGRRLRPIWTDIQEDIAKLGIHLQENLSGVNVVRAFSREPYEIEGFRKKASQYYDDGILSSKIQAFNMPLMAFIFTLISGLVIWYGGREVVGGRLTPGELTQFYFYLAMMIMPIRMLGFMVNLVSRGIAAGDRIFEVLDAQSAVKEKPDATELGNVKGSFQFESVAFGYDTNPYESLDSVLEKIDLEAKPGEMVALLGSTGSGKSTLVNLIPRFYDVTSGHITIDGIDIRDVSLTSLRRSIGIVQQDVFLFSATVRDNIVYGATDASDEQVLAATKAAYLHEFIESLPDGYDTWVGERGLTLSGGQKQRLAIARTLLVDPRILIFDDSTSSVDTQTEFLIQKALRELMKGRTTFVIAQRLQTVRDADQILVLDKGTIVERGTHAQLLEKGTIYRQIYELQLRDQEEALGKEGDQP
jgi:ABC-type multidrug transport system fused ATPase/permease subunit